MSKVVDLYEGKLRVDFDEERHVYTCTGDVTGGQPERWPSVSRAESAIDLGKSGAFAWWSVNVMRDFILASIPRDEFGNGRMIHPSELEELVKEGRLAHDRVKKDAASTGRDVHSWIDEYVKSKMAFGEPPPLPTDPKQLNAVSAFLSWENEHSVLYEDSELIVASLEHKYIGTLDRSAAVVSLDGIRAIRDTKTSNGMRKGYRLQTAGYVMAYNEMFPEKKIWKRVIDILGKDEPSFTPYDCRYNDMTDEESTLIDFDGFLKAMWFLGWDARAEAHMPKRPRKKR